MSERSSEPSDAEANDVQRCAGAVAARLSGEAASFAEAAPALAADYAALLRAVARLGPSYAFDPDGRPAAIEAVRQALPMAERDLFDAILEDYACERAAVEEGLYRVALEYGRRGPQPPQTA